jgi:hypothetical protein
VRTTACRIGAELRRYSMRTNTSFGSDIFTRGEPRPGDPKGGAFRLTRRAALGVILVLSLGLWAALWTAVASLASAVLG